MNEHNKLSKHFIRLHNNKYTNGKNECMETFLSKIIGLDGNFNRMHLHTKIFLSKFVTEIK